MSGQEGVSFSSLLDYSAQQICDLLNCSFQGYLTPIRFDAAMLSALIRYESIDLAASRRVVISGSDAGIANIARRGERCRVAAFAIRPEARRRGLGLALLERVAAEARSRGERLMTLEVIEQNPAAIALYDRAGFRIARRLVGYNRAAGLDGPSPRAAERLEAATIREVAIELMRDPQELPWQLAGETVSQLALPNRAYRLGPALCAISDTAQATTVALRALVVPLEERGKGWAGRLLKALFAQYPDKTWRVPVDVPDDLAPGLFRAAGFTEESTSQFQMDLDLRTSG